MLGLIGGAFAYFTDTETSNGNTFTAGTLGIQIADNNEGYYDNIPVNASYVSPAGWAPGDEFTTGSVYLRNVGSIDIHRIYARFGGLTESAGGFSQYIKLISYWESPDGGTTWYEEKFTGDDGDNANAYLGFWNGRGATFALDGVISLYDLVVARDFGSGDMITSLCMFDGEHTGGSTSPLAAGGVAAFKFTFQLMPEVTNVYQGANTGFGVNFIATGIDTYPDDSIWESVLDMPLVP